MIKQIKVALYVRTNAPNKTPDAQLRALRQYVAAHGWTDVKECIDVGISGLAESRPAWNRLWQAIQDDQVQVLLVHSVDRLTRSCRHLQHIVEALAERSIILIVGEDSQ